MKKGKSKELLIEVLKETIPIALKKQKLIDDLSDYLLEFHDVQKADFLYYIGDFKRLEEADSELLGLLAEQVHVGLGLDGFELEEWFTNLEIKRIKIYKMESGDQDDVPEELVFENVVYLGDGVYQCAMSFNLMARLYKYKRLVYNFEFQREAKEHIVNGKVVKEIKVYRKNVQEIKERILAGTLKKTAIAYNCRVGSTEDSSEYELLFDEQEQTLTITKGTVIEILDGTHRTMGAYEAYVENPDIEGKITVLFSNYTEEQAKEYQVELAKQTPFNKTRARQLAESSLADELTNRLNSKGALKGAIATKNSFNKEIYTTSFEIISNTFGQVFKIEKRSQINTLLKDFNNYLEYIYDQYEDNERFSILFDKFAFVGHIVILKNLVDVNDTDAIDDLIEGIFIRNSERLSGVLEQSSQKTFSIRIKELIKLFEKMIIEI